MTNILHGTYNRTEQPPMANENNFAISWEYFGKSYKFPWGKFQMRETVQKRMKIKSSFPGMTRKLLPPCVFLPKANIEENDMKPDMNFKTFSMRNGGHFE